MTRDQQAKHDAECEWCRTEQAPKTGTLRQVELPGRQVRQTKLNAWATAEGVEIVEQVRLVSRSPLVVEVRVQPKVRLMVDDRAQYRKGQGR